MCYPHNPVAIWKQVWKRDLNLVASDFCLSPLITGTGSLALPYPTLQEGKHRRQTTNQYFEKSCKAETFFSFSKTTVINLVAQGFITPVSTVLDAVSAATSGNAGTVGEENSIASPARALRAL